MNNQRLKILVLIKPFWIYPKHQPKIDMIKALEKYADVYYWYYNGHINNILKSLNITPDFIFHYDIAWNYGLAPQITGLDSVDILKGCFVIDLHWEPEKRIQYFNESKVDLIFSATKNPFLKVFPSFKEKLRWLPWSINPNVMKDWELTKDIDSLLMGLVYVDEDLLGNRHTPKKIPPKGRYAFRDAVFKQLKDDPAFTFYPHPGHRVQQSEDLIVNEKYAQMLNRSKLFYTCGSRDKLGGVAVLKFFEAPASRTLLIAEENEDIKDLGFIDGENYVACRVEDINEKTKYYLSHDKERQRITDNGYQFIHQHHTNDHRAQSMVRYIKELL